MALIRMKQILDTHRGDDLSSLKITETRLEKLLSETNEKLGSLRHLIRLEKRVRIRETFLDKSYTLVWEQETMRKVLEKFRKKIFKKQYQDAVSRSLKLDADKKKEQNKVVVTLPTINVKLMELFMNPEAEAQKKAKSEKAVSPKSSGGITEKRNGYVVPIRKRKLSGEFIDLMPCQESKNKPIVKKKSFIGHVEDGASLQSVDSNPKLAIKTEDDLTAIQENRDEPISKVELEIANPAEGASPTTVPSNNSNPKLTEESLGDSIPTQENGEQPNLNVVLEISADSPPLACSESNPKITEETAKNWTETQNKPEQPNMEEEQKSMVQSEESSSPQYIISNIKEALAYLAALQDYAMLNENFRATGLLIEAEKALKNPPSSNDFEL